jgi:hypothetical protein
MYFNALKNFSKWEALYNGSKVREFARKRYCRIQMEKYRAAMERYA